jgi:hypothetical protein
MEITLLVDWQHRLIKGVFVRHVRQLYLLIL